MQKGTRPVGAGRRRIIERPRLTRMLDESGARIILLVAPAGYGKTTLANEWLSRGDRRSTWYRADAASADVAALAVGLARAAAKIVPGAGERMRDRLRATDRPEDESEVLAEMLIDDLVDWPNEAWLAIDDYQFAMESSAAEDFVGALASDSAIRLMITSRRRPQWASARQRVYGEVAELTRNDLAMSMEEAGLVLDGRAGVQDLVAQASGWPAVIGLAALTQRDRTPVDQVPAALYEFLAEELFQDVDQPTQDGLVRLALAPTITESLGEFLLGVRASGILDTAVHRGLLDRNGMVYEFHPLLRAFLQRKLSESGEKAVEDIARAVSEHLIDSGLWDDAFALISNSRMPALLPGLIEASLDSLLLEGRTATLRRWINASDEAQIQSPIVDLAEAELSFREGIHSKTEALALAAARRVPAEHPIASRAYSLAGRSAYFEGRCMDALKLHRTAFDLSRSLHTTRTALWGQFLTYLELENDTAALAVFEELENVEAETTEDLLRLATGRFQLAARRVESGLSELLAAVPLLSRSRDPLSRSAFLNVCAGGLVLSARYNEALETIEQQIAEAREYRLNFALPHAYLRKAGAMLGRRAFREAHSFLDRAERLAPETRDPRLVGSAHVTRAIAYLACGRLDEAMAAAAHGPSAQSSKTASAELAATRALISACTGDSKATVREAREAEATSKALEITILSEFASAIDSCHRDDPAAPRRVNDSISKALKGGALDFFVAAYRGYPPLLNYVDDESWLALSPEISQIPDQPLSSKAKPGVSFKPVRRSPNSLLSNRETEVFGLLAQGLTNKQIAHSLVVSESTVKVHVRHIFEKLGVRTRTAAASLHRNERDRPSRSSPPGEPELDDLELPT